MAGPPQVFLVSSAGGPWTQLTFQGGFWPNWTPDGDAVAYCVLNGSNYDIMIVGVD